MKEQLKIHMNKYYNSIIINAVVFGVSYLEETEQPGTILILDTENGTRAFVPIDSIASLVAYDDNHNAINVI